MHVRVSVESLVRAQLPHRRGLVGKLTIARATRKIEYGEELCWNYSCVTESEKEYRAAICLCSSTTCKGAFLDFAGSSAFTAVMNRRHNFLDRNARAGARVLGTRLAGGSRATRDARCEIPAALTMRIEPA